MASHVMATESVTGSTCRYPPTDALAHPCTHNNTLPSITFPATFSLYDRHVFVNCEPPPVDVYRPTVNG